MPVQIQARRGTSGAWSSANPTLLSGEIGYESDTGLMKVGDGTTAWNLLRYTATGPAGRGIPGMDGDDGDENTWRDLAATTRIPPQREFLIKPVVLTADSATQTSTTEAIISPQLPIPAGFPLIGSTFEIEFATSCAQGAVAQTTPGIVYRLRWGGLTGTIICTANAVITPATTLAATPGQVRAVLTVRTLGGTGTAKGYIEVVDPRIVREATTGGIYVRTGKSGAAVTINTTTANILCVTSQGTAADAALLTFGESGFAQLTAY